MIKRIIGICLCSIALISCSNTQVPQENTQKSNLTVGIIKTRVIEKQTTQTEILQLFGSPNLITTSSQGEEVWTYSKSSFKASSSSRNTVFGAVFVAESESLAISDASTTNLDLIIVFNKNGIVDRYNLISASF